MSEKFSIFGWIFVSKREVFNILASSEKIFVSEREVFNIWGESLARIFVSEREVINTWAESLARIFVPKREVFNWEDQRRFLYPNEKYLDELSARIARTSHKKISPNFQPKY